MPESRRNRLVHLFFDIGVIAKGVDGVLELVGGALLFFVSSPTLYHIARVLTRHELSTDPDDPISNYLLDSTRHLSHHAKIFAAIYLLWHGVVKLGLVAGLLLKKHLAYPAAMIAFGLFILYQLYRYMHTHAPELIVLSVLDAVVIVLTWFEYKRLQSEHAFR